MRRILLLGAAILLPLIAQSAEPSGKQLFNQKCAMCHGAVGMGTGLLARRMKPEIAPLENCLTEDPIGVMYTGSLTFIHETHSLLRQHPVNKNFSLATTEYPARDFAMLDVAHPSVSKGAALAEWTAHRGYSREETMAIGDNHNDREMLEFAGLPIVMANCVEELKSTGWRSTLSNDEGGVAAAIDAYALGNAN